MRLAVLGSPISHSKSPILHAAAYRVLGLDWDYAAVELDGAGLRGFVESLDEDWRGLSLTMPLKRDVIPLLDEADELVRLTGSANTVLLTDGLRRGYNTDVFGIVEALRSAGVTLLETAQVLGGGATAASAVAALAQLGARSILVSVRDPQKSMAIAELGRTLGVDMSVRNILMQDRSLVVRDVVLSTLPGNSRVDLRFPAAAREGSVLFDVAYNPWPSTFARHWAEVGGAVVSGLDMLVLQALAQVRIFVHGDPTTPFDNDAEVLRAMRAAVAI